MLCNIKSFWEVIFVVIFNLVFFLISPRNIWKKRIINSTHIFKNLLIFILYNHAVLNNLQLKTSTVKVVNLRVGEIYTTSYAESLKPRKIPNAYGKIIKTLVLLIRHPHIQYPWLLFDYRNGYLTTRLNNYFYSIFPSHFL